MKPRRLESMTISNFRSIGGRVTIPFDAPVVLIHGPNGSGKTSILSALELAMSGSIDAMRRVDSRYVDYLIHRGADTAEIELTVQQDTAGPTQTWAMTSREEGWARDHLLSDSDAVHYSERSYLAQATLGRLLEIYSETESTQSSALTRFVNDVLGLDALEALIEGLQNGRDLRNARNLVPGFAGLERSIAANKKEHSEIQAQNETLTVELREADQLIANELTRLKPDGVANPQEIGAALDTVVIEAEDAELTRLIEGRRKIEVMQRRLLETRDTAFANDITALEAQASAALRVSMDWTRDSGDRIERALEDARTEFPDLPSMAATSPIEAVENGLSLTLAELARTNAALEADREARARSEELTARRESAEAQLALINEQIAAEVEGTAEIARLLAEMVPHIHGDECVVCGRDYSEISDEPLAAEAARRAARFGEQAERLTSLSRARQSVAEEQQQLIQELTAIGSRVLEQPARSAFLTKQARLETWAARFQALEGVSRDGSRILRESSEARRSLAAARNDAGTATELAESLKDLCVGLQLPVPAETDSVESSLERAAEEIKLRSNALEQRALVRRSIRETWRTRQQLTEQLESGNAELKRLQEDGHRLQASHSSFEGKRNLARQIHRAATETQRAIIRTVFNESLNAVWRDLFVRLAPNEPFVPAFHVAEIGQGVGPQLVTVHRAGGNGGAPGTMLSSGNLNTAALTLFLALHLSAGEQMPMLILDDPVQSMDDVHISQFAALLRTLSKQHGRQVVVAVHERSLFDYLALELSPAFEGDRLITVELKKQMSGMTFVEPQYRLWKEDPVRASA